MLIQRCAANFVSTLVVIFNLALCGYALAADDEPIAYIGHGGFFDRTGKQIEVTLDFIERAQAYYRERLLKSIPEGKAKGLLDAEKKSAELATSSRQDRLLLNSTTIMSMAANSNDPEVGRIKSKLNALTNAMRMVVPEQTTAGAPLSRIPLRKFVPDPDVRDAIQKQSLHSVAVVERSDYDNIRLGEHLPPSSVAQFERVRSSLGLGLSHCFDSPGINSVLGN